MHTWSFTLILNGAEFTDERMDALFEAGCGDALFGESAGIAFADFAREAPDLETAITSARRAVESVSPLHVVRAVIDEEALAAL